MMKTYITAGGRELTGKQLGEERDEIQRLSFQEPLMNLRGPRIEYVREQNEDGIIYRDNSGRECASPFKHPNEIEQATDEEVLRQAKSLSELELGCRKDDCAECEANKYYSQFNQSVVPANPDQPFIMMDHESGSLRITEAWQEEKRGKADAA